MSMEKLKKCRICLVENVRMYVVANKNLQEIYEKLTDIPFVTEDSRPILACFYCCSKLKQCYQMQRKCLAAEELFAQMLNENYETKPLINQDPLQLFSGFNITPTVHISIVDECQTESIAIKEELPDVCERLDDNIEPKEELQSDELEPENLDNSCLDAAHIPPHHSESDLEDDVPLMEFKIEVEEEQELSKTKHRTSETKRANVAKKPNLDARRIKVEYEITAQQTKKEKSDSTVIQRTQKLTSKPGTYCKEPYKCDKRSINPVKKYTQHTRTQHGEAPYKCDVCQRSFSEKRYLSKHKQIHTGEKPYKCDLCQRSFIEKSALMNHTRVHTGEKPFKCDICQCSFRHTWTLKTHVRQHTGEKAYKCDSCQRSFNQKAALTNHIRIHTGEKPFKCDICQCSFRQSSHLTTHIRQHTGEKPYKCDVCQRSFSQKFDLTKHNRIHTGEKPYKCDACQRSFSQKSALTKHIRIHTGEKPYKCDVCQRCFREKRALTKHIRIHTGEKPYVCHVCQCSFNQKSHLTTHIRVHTGEKSL